MGMNRIQFQPGLSLEQFQENFGTEEKCEKALEDARWPEGFRCPRCAQSDYGIVNGRRHKRYQCKSCRHQTTLTAGTIMESTKLLLRTWFLAFYFISHAKNGISALELMRHLGVSYRTGWLLHHKIMKAMALRDDAYVLCGKVQLDDAYLGGELNGGKAGRGSENKVPIVAAVSINSNGHPLRVKLSPVNSFTSEAISDWAKAALDSSCEVVSDGLACFRSVTSNGCTHKPIVAAGRHPKDLPEFKWVNTFLGNLKTSISGTYHAFTFEKYSKRYMGAFSYLANRRFDLSCLVVRIMVAVCSCAPHPEHKLRLAELPH
jgi:transposase-like protein